MGALEATEKGAWAGAQRTMCARQTPPPGQAQRPHCPPAQGPSRPGGPTRPLKAALNRGTGRSLVPTAWPHPAWASLGSAAVERGSGCLQSGPLVGLCCSDLMDHSPPRLPLNDSHAQPQAPLPFCFGIRGMEEMEALSACLRRPWLPPAGLSHGGLVLQGTRPQPEPHPQATPGPGRTRPLTHVHAPLLEHLRARSPSLRGLTAGAVLALGHSRPCRGLAEATPSLRGRRAVPRPPPLLPSLPHPLQCRPSSSTGPSAGLALSPLPFLAPGLREVCSSHRPLAPLTHTSSWPSKSRPQNGSGGVCGQPRHLKGSVGTMGWTPPDAAHQAHRRTNPATQLLILPQRPLHLLC